MLSTKEEPTVKAEAFALGANDYIVKLPDRLELLARIRYHSKGYINLLQRNEAYQALLESQKRLANEMKQAANYVRSLLPDKLKKGDIRTDWRFIPSAELGGDSFGYHWLDDDHFAFYLLDVSGHGVGSALLSVSAMNALRSQALPQTDFRDPGQVSAALNNAFQMDQQNGLFFTIWYGVYHKPTRRIDYAGGGHPPALLLTGPTSDGQATYRSTPAARWSAPCPTSNSPPRPARSRPSACSRSTATAPSRSSAPTARPGPSATSSSSWARLPGRTPKTPGWTSSSATPETMSGSEEFADDLSMVEFLFPPV